MTPAAPVLRVDTALVAPARLRDTRDVKALEDDGHAVVRHQKDRAGRTERWETRDPETGVVTGRHLKHHKRIRPGVRVGDRVYRAPLHVHRLDEVAVEFIRRAIAHGRAALLRLDVAADIECESQQAADALHREFRERVFLVGARGKVRVSHATSTSPGTTYIGASKDEETAQQGEGAVLVIYSDDHAAEKNGGRPTCHVELRLFGARVVRAAVGRGIDIVKAWERVRLVEDLSRAGYGIRRLASRGGGIPYAQDVHEEMRLLGFDRRPVFGRATPFLKWAGTRAPRRNPAGRRDSPAAAVAEGRRTQSSHGAAEVESPTRAMTGSSIGSTHPLRLRFKHKQVQVTPRFRYQPIVKESFA